MFEDYIMSMSAVLNVTKTKCIEACVFPIVIVSRLGILVSCPRFTGLTLPDNLTHLKQEFNIQ